MLSSEPSAVKEFTDASPIGEFPSNIVVCHRCGKLVCVSLGRVPGAEYHNHLAALDDVELPEFRECSREDLLV